MRIHTETAPGVGCIELVDPGRCDGLGLEGTRHAEWRNDKSFGGHAGLRGLSAVIAHYTKIYAILPPGSRRSFLWVCAVSACVGLAETVGVLSVLPFVTAAANPDVFSGSGWLTTASEVLGLPSHRAVLIALGTASFVALCGAIAFRAYALVVQTRFARVLTADFSTLLMGRYLSQEYAWFLSRHSADLNKSVLSEVEQVVEHSVMTAIRLLSLTAVTVCLIVVLFVADPIVTLALSLVLGGSYGAVFFVMRRRLMRLGAERISANRARFETVQEAMSGIKAVKMYRLERWFLSRYALQAERIASIRTRIKLMSDLPSYGLEAVIFGGMVLFVLWILISRGSNLLDVLPLMSLFAVAGIRLFPVLQQLFVAFATLRAHKPAVDAIYADITELRGPAEAAATPVLSLGAGLKAKSLFYTYPGSPAPALQDINLHVPAGAVIGVAGETGAGKSTLVDVVLGLLLPDDGNIIVDGQTIDAETRPGWQAIAGYVPQTVHLADDSLAANIAFGVAPEDRNAERMDAALRVADLDVFVAGLRMRLETRVGETGVRLSGGQRQRVGLARALYRQPDFLVLDEATSALDTATETKVLDHLRSKHPDMAVLMVAHRLTSLTRCDYIYVLADGAVIAEGSFSDLSQGDAAFRALHRLGA